MVYSKTGRAKGLRVETENAGGTETAENPAVANMVEQPLLFQPAISAGGWRGRCGAGGGGSGGGGFNIHGVGG